MKLFCFPYAGGSSVVFNKWKQYIHPRIDLVPIEYTGRGKRAQEPLYDSIDHAVVDVFKLIRSQIESSSYAFFGHSMGSIIAYKLVQRIREHGMVQPLHTFFSGRGAPHVKKDEKQIHLMNDEEFRKEVLQLGGTAPEFFDHPELLQFFMPMLKNDFRIVETDEVTSKIHPLDNVMTVFVGKDDELTAAQIEGWQLHTNQFCDIQMFEGGHFFIHQHAETIVSQINDTLMAHVSV